MVGVSWPSAWVRSWPRISNRLTCSIRASFRLTRSTSVWTSRVDPWIGGDRDGVGRDPEPLSQFHRFVAVEGKHRGEVRAPVHVNDRLGDVAALAELELRPLLIYPRCAA